MKKKLLIVLLALVASLCLAFGLVGCDILSDDGTTDNSVGIASAYIEDGCLYIELDDGTVIDYGEINIDASCSHEYGEWKTELAATCTSVGFEIRNCTLCGNTDFRITDATEHSFTEYNSDGNATCTEDGTKTAYCDNGCGTTNTVADEGTATGHSFTEYNSDGNATCTEDGTKTAACDNVCGTTNTVTDEGSATGHKYSDDWTTNDESHWHECEVCGEKSDEGYGEHSFNGRTCTTCKLTIDYTPGLAYTSNGNYYTVSGIGTATETDIVIPSTYNGLPVTSIDSSAFAMRTSLTSVTIPDSVTSIGSSAFEFCTSLESVTIGNSVTSIGDYAFAYCDSLTSLTIGNSVTSIGDWAFFGCDSLTSVTIPDSVTSIGESAFLGTSITVVYYCGDEDEWNKISIGSNNTDLTSEKIYYYSESKPNTSGNYWHYVDGVATAW